MDRTYSVVLLCEHDGRYSAIVSALGCASWGHTVPEALQMVEEAMRLCIESLEAHGDPVPADTEQVALELGDATHAFIYRLRMPEQHADNHVILRHPKTGRAVVVPVHDGRDLPPGTLRTIIRQSGLTVEEFIALLD